MARCPALGNARAVSRFWSCAVLSFPQRCPRRPWTGRRSPLGHFRGRTPIRRHWSPPRALKGAAALAGPGPRSERNDHVGHHRNDHPGHQHPEDERSPRTLPEQCPGTSQWRRRRDLNPRGAMHPYLLSREAHSTGLCDVSSGANSTARAALVQRRHRPHREMTGGGRGIRTPGAIADTAVFKTATFGRSVSPPDPTILPDDPPEGRSGAGPDHRLEKKFQDFLSEGASSGLSSRPRDRAAA